MTDTHLSDPDLEPVVSADAPDGNVSGDRITIEQSNVGTVTGEQVRINQTAIKTLTMKSGTMTQSAAAKLAAEEVALHESSAGSVTANRVDVFDSTIGVLRGPMTVRGGASRVFLHIGEADCTVHPVITGRGALAAGLGFGASFAIIGGLVRRILKA
jgi:hypothetical protein